MKLKEWSVEQRAQLKYVLFILDNGETQYLPKERFLKRYGEREEKDANIHM